MAYLRCLPTVKAASEGSESKSRRVRPVDLDIYNEPVVVPSAIVEEVKPLFLQKYVSVVRKQFWKFKDVTVGAYNSTEAAIIGAKDGVVSMIETAKSDPLSAVRPGCITAAVLAGAIIQGRGRKPFRRLASGTVAGTLVASVAYPDKAFKVAKKVYYESKDATTLLVERMRKIVDQRQETKEATLINISEEHVDKKIEDEAGYDASGEFPELTNEDAKEIILEKPVESLASTEKSSDFVVHIIKDETGEDVCLIEDVKLDNKASKSSQDSTNGGESQSSENSSFVNNQDNVDELNEPVLQNNLAETPLIKDDNNKSIEASDAEIPAKLSPVETSDTINLKEASGTNGVTEEKNSELFVDYGQSNPEDKDMYSTRS